MALDTNFNVNPYYDDFDEDKKFLRMLFRPGYAVQARELTQLQTILQKQVERFGDHVFKNGSVVSGGQTILQDATYLKLDSSYAGSAVSVSDFVGATIVDNVQNPTKRAEVIKVYDADTGTGDPKTLLVKQIFGSAFTPSETIAVFGGSVPTFANIATSGVGTGQVFSIDEGVFYYDGFFIKNDAQTIATSKYSNTTANARIGFEITESVVEPTTDTTLLDPALDASNYQAPGSTRYKIDLVLATRSLTSVDDTQFIELARVENGVLTTYTKFPVYAVLEDTLARRTFDESGNYTVRPFKISLDTQASNTANMSITLSPGKAYVYGYEFETIAPTSIVVDKPRETDSVANKRLTADYGYYVYSNTHYGSLPINSLTTVDLHCVSNSLINVSSTGAISNTKIGTARIKAVNFDSAANTLNAATYEYRTYLFDIDVGSITGGVNNAGTNTTHLQLSTTPSNYASANEAYTGAKIRILSGPGAGETPKTIINYNGTSKTVELSEPFNQQPNGTSVWSIDFEFNDVKSLAVTSGTTRVAAADIDDRSKDYATPYDDTFIYDTAFEPLIFPLGEQFIADGSISDLSFSYKRLYESQTFSASQSPALSVGTGETIASATSDSAKNENYQVVVTSAGTSPYKVGQIISSDLFTVDTGTRKITVVSGNNMTANIVATIDSSTPTAKAKTYVAGNTTLQTSGGADIFANGTVNLYGIRGQIHIAANTVVKTPDTAQSLFTSDVVGLVSVLDFNGLSVTTANVSSATNITNRYTLDNGQRDSYYDHAAIKLKPGVATPTGPLVVTFNQFVSSGAGFFSVDSYGVTYENIPSYTGSNGIKYELRDCLDFRPVRANATVATASSVVFDVDSTTTGPKIPENGSDIILDYDYYLPRIDKVILNKNKTFEILKGVPSLTPVEPKDKDNSMTLYVLRNPAYVANTSNIQVQYINNKRYTMRDIGGIEKRVENLEYYTSLSLLEQETLAKQDLTILDTQNLPRFKNGLIVDSFDGHSVADVTKNDYQAAIDPVNKELRPSFNISAYTLTFDSANSSGVTRNGSLVTVTPTLTSFIDQPKASKAINVNPFNVVNFLGKVELEPKSDIWIDTNRRPDVLVNFEGDKDAWELITNQIPWTYEWGDWQTYWTGQLPTQSTFWSGNRLIERTTETSVQSQTRTGTVSAVAPETITQSIGDRVIDVSIIPYMREKSVLFVGSDFKPSTTLYPFFDSTLVESFTARANKFVLTSNNLSYQTEVGNFENVTIFNNVTSTTNGTATIVKTSNNEAFVVSVTPTTSFAIANANLIGATSGSTYQIQGYEHYSGFAAASSSNTVTLAVDASGANNSTLYGNAANSNTIFIVAGTGAGQTATISSYNVSTRVVTVSSDWTTVPDTTSVYSIGRPTTTAAGDIAGVYTIPASRFRVGEKLFRLIDNNSNDTGSSSTNGDASFFAQGVLQGVEETIVSTTVPTIQRATVTDERVVSTVTSVRDRVIGWTDPLAQTFLIDPIQFPQGIFINRLRFCFKTKDDVVPVTLQLRPAVNGYPSASIIYPNGTVSLTPDRVKVTESPDLEDSAKYTEFVFDSPVYVQPGEHAFVLLANSNKYQVYAAQVGSLDLVDGRQISEQPYGGSLFLSQNGSTWTADQSSDLMFRIYRDAYSTSTGVAQFRVSAPSSNTVYDLIHLISADLNIANTSINYQFNSVINSTGGAAGLKPITPLTDYPMNDGSGRRVLTTTNNSFILRATMATTSPLVSPVIDASRIGILAIENKVNDLPLVNTGINITNSGSNYTTNSNVSVTITGGGGSGATAAAVVTNNVITSVYFTNGGSGYTSSPTISISDAGSGTSATVTYNGEDKKSGGNSDVRYIMRKVTLADGFDSGDLRVYLTAYKPSGSNVLVYYKLLSKSDPEAFDDKNYQLMTELGNQNFVSTNKNDYRELTFAPGSNGVANNSVTYTSGSTAYNTFRTFAIKIVITGSDTTDVAKIQDVRVIALPSGA